MNSKVDRIIDRWIVPIGDLLIGVVGIIASIGRIQCIADLLMLCLYMALLFLGALDIGLIVSNDLHEKERKEHENDGW